MDFTGINLYGKSPQEIVQIIPRYILTDWKTTRPYWKHNNLVYINFNDMFMPTGIPCFSWMPHQHTYIVIAKTDKVPRISLPESHFVPHPCLLQSESLKKILHQCLFTYDLNIAGALAQDEHGNYHEFGIIYDDNLTQKISKAELHKCLTDNGWKASDVQTCVRKKYQSKYFQYQVHEHMSDAARKELCEIFIDVSCEEKMSVAFCILMFVIKVQETGRFSEIVIKEFVDNLRYIHFSLGTL